MEKVLIEGKEQVEIAKNLDSNPELLKVMTAAASLTPEDQKRALQFVNERRRGA